MFSLPTPFDHFVFHHLEATNAETGYSDYHFHVIKCCSEKCRSENVRPGTSSCRSYACRGGTVHGGLLTAAAAPFLPGLARGG